MKARPIPSGWLYYPNSTMRRSDPSGLVLAKQVLSQTELHAHQVNRAEREGRYQRKKTDWGRERRQSEHYKRAPHSRTPGSCGISMMSLSPFAPTQGL